MKNIIITGSSGLLATELINLLINDKEENYKIYAVTTNIDKLKLRYSNPKVVCTTIDNLKNLVGEKEIDTIVHCAFARGNNALEIAKSLDYTKEILQISQNINLLSFINISSQGIYGTKAKPFLLESHKPDPSYLYAMAKYSTEIMTELTFEKSKVNYTNIRLASIANNANFLNVFISNAINGKPINLQGGKQRVSLIDVEDAANGIYNVINNAKRITLSKVYNLGINNNISLLEIVEYIKLYLKKNYGKDVIIDIKEDDINFEVGMDSSKFYKEFNWKPQRNTFNTIEYLIKEFYKN